MADVEQDLPKPASFSAKFKKYFDCSKEKKNLETTMKNKKFHGEKQELVQLDPIEWSEEESSEEAQITVAIYHRDPARQAVGIEN